MELDIDIGKLYYTRNGKECYVCAIQRQGIYVYFYYVIKGYISILSCDTHGNNLSVDNAGGDKNFDIVADIVMEKGE